MTAAERKAIQRTLSFFHSCAQEAAADGFQQWEKETEKELPVDFGKDEHGRLWCRYGKHVVLLVPVLLSTATEQEARP